MLLTEKELIEFTGTPSAVKQKNILTAAKIGFLIRADRKIAVTWESINSALIGKSMAGKATDGEPNFDALRMKGAA